MPSFDQAAAKRGRRFARERGAWIYVPAEILRAADREFADDGGAPFYRLWSGGKGRVGVQFYRHDRALARGAKVEPVTDVDLVLAILRAQPVPRYPATIARMLAPIERYRVDAAIAALIDSGDVERDPSGSITATERHSVKA